MSSLPLADFGHRSPLTTQLNSLSLFLARFPSTRPTDAPSADAAAALSSMTSGEPDSDTCPATSGR